MSSILQWIADHAEQIPFIVGAAGPGAPQLEKKKILESIISGVVVGAVLAAAGYLLMVPRIVDGVTARLESHEQRLMRLESTQEQIKSRVETQHGELQFPSRMPIERVH